MRKRINRCDEERNRASNLAIICIAVIVQLAIQSAFFPLSDIATPKPSTHIDGAYHLYQLEVARELCETKQLVGFDPTFAAGHIGGIPFNASAKVQALVTCALGTPDAAAIAWKLCAFAFAVLGVAALPLGCLRLKLGPFETATATVSGFVLLWASPFRWYQTAGMVSFVAAALFALPFSIWLSETCRAPRFKAVVVLAFAGAFGTLLHPLFPLCVAPLAVALTVRDGVSLSLMRDSASVLAPLAAATVLINAPWMYYTLRYPELSEQPYQRLVDLTLFVREPLGIAATASGGSRWYLALILCAAVAAVARTHKKLNLIIAFAVASACQLVFAFAGAASNAFAVLQPNRFALVGWLGFVIPAAIGFKALVDTVRNGVGAIRVAALSVLLLVIPLSAYYAKEVVHETTDHGGARYGVAPPEIKGFGPSSQEFIKWISDNVRDDGRILFETSRARVHDASHMAGVYARRTGKEFIGGPYPYLFFAGFWDGTAFGHQIDRLGPDALNRYLDLYNITWIVCHSISCANAASSLAHVAPATTIGPMSVFQRRSESSYFLRGAGRIIERRVNRLTVEIESKDDVVLKYHWFPELRSEPPADLRPITQLDDQQPFLQIRNPPRRLTVFLPPPGSAVPLR